MTKDVTQIVVVGGGTAGWLSAGIIAAHYQTQGDNAINVTLVESPDVATIGVGEGTWPSMRGTLKKLGISEAEFILHCDASFKQASKFNNWLYEEENGGDSYYHPFTIPTGFFEANIAEQWLQYREQINFANATSSQSHLCEQGKAPKQIATPEYAFLQNYGYHLDAGKFSNFLTKHCTQKLAVKHIKDNVTAVNTRDDGAIASIATAQHGDVEGDLFIDCTGFTGLLIDKHYGISLKPQDHILFNDRALAAQVPYSQADAPIASHTVSSAQDNGWIWDIGLQSRRGVGHVYASNFTSDEQAEIDLRRYISRTSDIKEDDINVRKLVINPGYREKFWHKNCVAIGLSAGFIEPLEASAIALIELSANFVAEQLPANSDVMAITAARFNRKFSHRWQRIIEFLKLHYVLSKRESDYWQANRRAQTIPEELQELLSLWRYQTPYQYDTHQTEELFPAASFQYILYGMGFETQLPAREKRANVAANAQQIFNENKQRTAKLMHALPSNRELINKIKQYGLSKV